MFATGLIVFREVLEAALIIGIVMAASRGVDKRHVLVWGGVGAGLLGACIVAALAGEIAGAAEGIGQELLNATILGAAVLMLGWHNVWMSRHGREMAKNLNEVGNRVSIGALPVWVLGSAVALAVLREGAEVVLFVYGIAASGAAPMPMLAGGVIGLGVGAAVGTLMYFGLLGIPMRHFFTVTGLLILLLAAGLAAQAAGMLVQAGLLPELGGQLWDTSWLISDHSIVGEMLRTLIGYTARPVGIQVVFYVVTLIIIGGLMKAIGRTPTNSKRVVGPTLAALAICTLLAADLLPRDANAAPYKVYSPKVVKGETEIEYRGYYDNDDDATRDGKEKHKFGVGYGVTDWWFSEIYGVWEKAPGGDRDYEALEWENKFRLTDPGKYWADFGLLTEIEKPDHGDVYEVKLAPLIEKQVGNLIFTGNLFFEWETGSGSSSGTTFAYAGSVRYMLDPRFEPAIEVFGEPGRINHWGSFNEQEHWIGPAVYGSVGIVPGQKVKYSGAVLFGETSVSPDQRFVVRLEYEFY